MKCSDENCTRAWKALHGTRSATHLSINCCPPYEGCVATLKGGTDRLAALPGNLCERRCAAKLSAAFYEIELQTHVPVCAARGGAASSPASSLALVGNYLHAQHVALDFGKTACPAPNGRTRVFAHGFLTADCDPVPWAPDLPDRARGRGRRAHRRQQAGET